MSRTATLRVLREETLPQPSPLEEVSQPGDTRGTRLGLPVALDRVSKSFGARPVLQALDLSIPAGQFLAVVGRSGGGKTTLLRLIAGLDKPTAGEVRIAGAPANGLQRSIRLLFQDSRLLLWQRVIGNVGLARERGWRETAAAALADVGLADRVNDWPSILSGGQKQRVALARAARRMRKQAPPERGPSMKRLRTSLTLIASALLAAVAYQAPAWSDELTIGYQTAVEPSKLAQADGTYEKATGWTINWRKFDSGADVIAAVASGDVQIGYVGSSPLASAASRELPIETIYVVGLIGDAEALVVRNGSNVSKPEDLVGKKIAVPFVSTTHYSLLAALKHWNINPKSVQILNLRPPEIVAAWERGDIDAAYVWDPALGKAKESGTVLVTSAEVAKWGAPTFDAWIARTDFSAAHAEVVTNFVRVTAATYKIYADEGASWTTDSPKVQAIAKLTGAKADDVPALLKAYQFPTLAEERDLLSGPIVKSIAETSAFLKEQGKIPAVLPDYAPYVTAKYVSDVLASN